MKENLIAELEETSKSLLETLSSFPQAEFNKIPFEGSWTAGQVAEHLFKSESNLPRVLNGNSKPTPGDPFEKTGIIRQVFLDYTIKLQSPPFILPSDEPKNRDAFIEGFKETRKQLKTQTLTGELERTFTDFTFPQLGHLTGWELICFVVCHSRRHIRQINSIAEKLKAAQAV